MKSEFPFLETMIIVAVIGLLGSLFLPSFLSRFKENQELSKLNNMTLPERNSYIIERSNIRKLFEYNGYDIYVLSNDGHEYCLAIPTINSVYKLEKEMR